MKKQNNFSLKLKRPLIAALILSAIYTTPALAVTLEGHTRLQTGKRPATIVLDQIFKAGGKGHYPQTPVYVGLSKYEDVNGQYSYNSESPWRYLASVGSGFSSPIPNVQPVHHKHHLRTYTTNPLFPHTSTTNPHGISGSSSSHTFSHSYSTTTNSHTTGTHNSELSYASLASAEDTLGQYILSQVQSVVQSTVLPEFKKDLGVTNAIFNVQFPVYVKTISMGGANGTTPQTTYTPYTLVDTINVYPNGDYSVTGFYQGNLTAPTKTPNSENVLIATYYQGELQYQLPPSIIGTVSPDHGQLVYKIFNVPLNNGSLPPPDYDTNYHLTYNGVAGAKLIASAAISYQENGYGLFDSVQHAQGGQNNGPLVPLLLNCSSIPCEYKNGYQAGAQTRARPGTQISESLGAVTDLTNQELISLIKNNNVDYAFLNYQDQIAPAEMVTVNNSYASSNQNTQVNQIPYVWTHGIEYYNHACGHRYGYYNSTQVYSKIPLQETYNYYQFSPTNNFQPQTYGGSGVQQNVPLTMKTYQSSMNSGSGRIPDGQTGNVIEALFLGSDQIGSNSVVLANGNGSSAVAKVPQLATDEVWISPYGGWWGSNLFLNKGEKYPKPVITNVCYTLLPEGAGSSNYHYVYHPHYHTYTTCTAKGACSSHEYVTYTRTCHDFPLPTVTCNSNGPS